MSPQTFRKWRAQSIEVKLPAVFTLLLGSLIALFVFAASRGVENSALDAARDRVRRVNTELAQLLASGNERRAAAIRALGETPSILQALTHPTQSAGAVATLGRLRSQSDSSRIVLLDSLFKIVAVTNREPPEAAYAELDALRSVILRQPTRTTRSPLFEAAGGIYFWAATPVGGGSSPKGVLAQLRQVTNSDTTSARALREMMGNATVYLTNARDNGMWITLDGRRAEPPRVDSTGTEHVHVRAEGHFLAHTQPIAGTPWILVAESSREAVRAHAVAFRRGIMPLAALLVLLGGLLAWLIARRFALPVRELADAARGIAAGDFSQRASVRSGDEVGQLAQSFNTMADAVEAAVEDVREANAELEDRVQKRTAELQAVNHELQTFSYSVSHDLRSPLRSMDGFSQALLEDYHDSLDDTGRNYLTRIRGAAQRMGALIDDLLLLSKITLQPIELQDVDLSAVAGEIIEELRQQHPGREVDVSIQPDLKVRADQGLMRVALQNLLSNAWKFTERTPEPRIEFGMTADRNGGEFFVRDNGAGFNMSYAHKLFIPFQRLHTDEEFAGTGIGLATVQRVLIRHGGYVRAASEPDRGATFTFGFGEPNGNG